MSSAERKNEKSSWISSAVEKFVAEMPRKDSEDESDDSQDWIELVKEGDEPDLCGLHLTKTCKAGSEVITLSANCVKCAIQRKYLLKAMEFENDREHWERFEERAAMSSANSCTEAEDQRMQLTQTSKDISDKNSYGYVDGEQVSPVIPKSPQKSADE